ncbi:hypothetical protein L3X38_027695 [Prunus dulcis]|uniref:Uncharacterized protein n=1 Tax=Prunus dulcis TaxID=3755 RepID=A0AAD4Z1E2_PRUDU|nr:hypothetical protein L3X38_027695 [Prunus dulcis]
MAMQVMVTGAMSIEEQLAHISEAVTKLTKMVEEKDTQIASLINNKWKVHQDKEPGQDAHKKGPHHEAESSAKGLGHETESDANVATIVFGSFDPVPLPALLKRLEFQSTRGIHQVTDPCTEEVVGKPNNQGGDGFVGDSSFDDNEGWTLVTW